MRTLAVLLISGFVSVSALAAEPPAEKIDWKVCDKEVKEHGCKGSDQEIWSCLEKHDKTLSESCQTSHEKGDKLFKK